MNPTNDERREMARRLRELPTDMYEVEERWESKGLETECHDHTDYCLIHYAALGCLPAEHMHTCDYEELHSRLADLIEPLFGLCEETEEWLDSIKLEGRPKTVREVVKDIIWTCSTVDIGPNGNVFAGVDEGLVSTDALISTWEVQLADLIEPEQTCRWVSVDDRLPDSEGEFIVAYHPCYHAAVDENKTLVGMDSFRGKTAWAKRKYQRVTHWMPKPEPPKVVEK